MLDEYLETWKHQQSSVYSEATLRSYIDNAPDGVFVVDADGHYLDANPAAQKITWYSIPEIISMSIQDIQPPESVEKDLFHFQDLNAACKA